MIRGTRDSSSFFMLYTNWKCENLTKINIAKSSSIEIKNTYIEV